MRVLGGRGRGSQMGRVILLKESSPKIAFLGKEYFLGSTQEKRGVSGRIARLERVHEI